MPRTAIKFQKSLAKYYEKWYRDCYDSAVYLKNQGKSETAEYYIERMLEYFHLINEYWYQIDFFKRGDNAYYIQSVTDKLWKKYLETEVYPHA